MKKNKWKIWMLCGLCAAFWHPIAASAEPINPVKTIDYFEEAEDSVMYGIGSVSKGCIQQLRLYAFKSFFWYRGHYKP